MGRSLMLVLAAALAVVVFAPAAFAQDDNPGGMTLEGMIPIGAMRGSISMMTILPGMTWCPSPQLPLRPHRALHPRLASRLPLPLRLPPALQPRLQ